MTELATLDIETTELVRLAAILVSGTEEEIRTALTRAENSVRPEWVEELILQTYLFAGFPRSLNAAREWRRVSGRAAPLYDEQAEYDVDRFTADGVRTCAIVYGSTFERLRQNIRGLHPALDSWMIVEGYGKVLSRPALDLARRELCIVAACAAARQDRQLHAHLHGAINAGASESCVDEALAALSGLVDADDFARLRALWKRVRDAQHPQ